MSGSLQITIDLGDTSVPVYRQIAGAIRVLLVQRMILPGEQLPTVRQLAAELGVHYNTVAESYRLLAAEGWLDLGRRRGATVLDKGVPPRAKPQSRKRFFQQLQQLLAEGETQGLAADEMFQMTRRILFEK